MNPPAFNPDYNPSLTPPLQNYLLHNGILGFHHDYPANFEGTIPEYIPEPNDGPGLIGTLGMAAGGVALGGTS